MRDPHGWAWSSARGEIRARRPTDGALLIASTVLLGLVLQTRFGGGGPSAAVQSLLRSLSVLGHVWRALIITGIVASAGVIVMAVIDRRWGLCRDLAVGALGAALLMFVLHHMSATPPRLAIDGVFPRGAKAWPVLRLSLASGLFAVAAPSLVRPLRYTAHVVLGAMAAATIALSGTNVNGVLIALCAGWIAASTVHLAFGSPGGRPSLDPAGSTAPSTTRPRSSPRSSIASVCRRSRRATRPSAT